MKSMGILNRKVQESKPLRQSNIELMRIIAMLMIVLSHWAGNNLEAMNEGYSSAPTLPIKILLELLSFAGNLGNTLFILTTGYFMIMSSFNFKKIIKIMLQVLFYSVTIMALFYLTGAAKFNLTIFLKSFFPTLFGLNWFISRYIVLLILSPFIKKALLSLNQKQHFILCCLLILLTVILPTFTPLEFNPYSTAWFIILFIIVSYIRLYPNRFFASVKLNAILAVCAWCAYAVSVVVFNLIGLKISVFATYANYFAAMHRLPIFICGICTFLFFKNIKLRPSKFISSIAATTLGVYLIHDSDNQFMRDWLWKTIFSVSPSSHNVILVLLYGLIVVVTVFTVCVIIEKLRQSFIEKPIWIFLDAHWAGVVKLEQKLDHMVDKLLVAMDTDKNTNK